MIYKISKLELSNSRSVFLKLQINLDQLKTRATPQFTSATTLEFHLFIHVFFEINYTY